MQIIDDTIIATQDCSKKTRSNTAKIVDQVKKVIEQTKMGSGTVINIATKTKTLA